MMAAISVLCAAAVVGIVAARPAARAPVAIGGVRTDPGGVGPGVLLSAFRPRRGDAMAAFSSGCFWGTEEKFRKASGVVATAVGYMGGRSAFPSYHEAHATGHAETVLVEFDPARISYEKLLGVYWSLRQPKVGFGEAAPAPDRDSPYRSSIWTFDSGQQRIATADRSRIERGEHVRILTRIQPVQPFYLAEAYHQQYDEKSGTDSCPIPLP